MDGMQYSNFSALFQDNYRFVLRYVLSVLSDKSMAEDVAQETFCEALHQYEEVCRSENPRGWLIKTAGYKILETERKLRKRGISLELLQTEAAERGSAERGYEIKELEMLLQGILTGEEKRYFIRRYFLGYSVRELAEREGKTENAMRVRLHRIKQKVNGGVQNKNSM